MSTIDSDPKATVFHCYQQPTAMTRSTAPTSMPFSVSLTFYNVHNDDHDCNTNDRRGGDGGEGVSFQCFSALSMGCTLDISYRITFVLF